MWKAKSLCSETDTAHRLAHIEDSIPRVLEVYQNPKHLRSKLALLQGARSEESFYHRDGNLPPAPMSNPRGDENGDFTACCPVCRRFQQQTKKAHQVDVRVSLC